MFNMVHFENNILSTEGIKFRKNKKIKINKSYIVMRNFIQILIFVRIAEIKSKLDYLFIYDK